MLKIVSSGSLSINLCDGFLQSRLLLQPWRRLERLEKSFLTGRKGVGTVLALVFYYWGKANIILIDD